MAFCNFTAKNLTKLRKALAITLPKKHKESNCDFVVRCIECPPLWKRVRNVISAYLGAGLYGTCLLVGRDTPYALKIVRPVDDDVRAEFERSRYFHSIGLSPKPIAYYEAPHPQLRGTNLSIILMEAMPEMLPSLLGKLTVSRDVMEGVAADFINMHAKMQTLGVCHGDLHFENIGVDKNARMRFIDMGYASTDHTCGALDMAQLIRTLSPAFMKESVEGAYDAEIKFVRAAKKAYGRQDPELRSQLDRMINDARATDKTANAVRNARMLRQILLRYASQKFPGTFKERMSQKQLNALHLRLHRAN